MLYAGYTHLLIESVCVTTHRQLSPLHPVYRLLAPHFLFLPAVNALVFHLVHFFVIQTIVVINRSMRSECDVIVFRAVC